MRNVLESAEKEGAPIYTGKMVIHRIEGPFPIGPWWLSRFVQLPKGFRMDIYCTLEDGEDDPIK